MAASDWAVGEPLVPGLSANCKPAVFVVRSTRRTPDAPSRPTHRYLPSEVTASLFGSLPTGIGVPSAPVAGSMETTELPYGAPTLAGTERYSSPFTGLYTMLLLVNGT